MSISAKYPGVCTRTWRNYSAGTPLTRTKDGWAIDDDVRLPPEATIIASCGDGESFTVGETLRNREGEIITVVACRSRYFPEDGLSFGVGAESGHVYTAICREATQEESNAVIAAEREREARRQSDAAYRSLFEKTAEERVPPRCTRPSGETVKINGGHTISGCGTEILIEQGEMHVWVLEDNGADGHCWADTNIGTPGYTGEIGFRFDATPERLSWVRNYQRCYEEQDAERAAASRMYSY